MKTKHTLITKETRDAYEAGFAAKNLTTMQTVDMADNMRNESRRTAFLLGAWGAIQSIDGGEFVSIVAVFQ